MSFEEVVDLTAEETAANRFRDSEFNASPIDSDFGIDVIVSDNERGNHNEPVDHDRISDSTDNDRNNHRSNYLINDEDSNHERNYTRNFDRNFDTNFNTNFDGNDEFNSGNSAKRHFSDERPITPVAELQHPAKKRASAKLQQLEREFQAYLDSLNPRNRLEVQRCFALVLQEKQDILKQRQLYMAKDREENEETRLAILTVLNTALLEIDEYVVDMRSGAIPVMKCREVAASARRKANGARGRVEDIRKKVALQRLEDSSEARARQELLNDRAYRNARSISMVTPEATSTRSKYRPSVNPSNSNEELLRRAFDDINNPGLLPDGNFVRSADRGEYMRAIHQNMIPGANLQDAHNLRRILGNERFSMFQNQEGGISANEFDEAQDGDESENFGYQQSQNYEELVDLALNEAEPLDMPPQMECFPLEHQRQGLGWLVRAERGRNRGGILADDMGLGKTIQTIALMYANQPTPKPNSNDFKLVLVVCPVALIATWADELKNRVKQQHRLRVYIHHKGMNANKLLTKSSDIEDDADVVICTYQGIVNEYKQLIRKKLADRQQDDPHNTAPPLEYGPFPLFEIKWHRVILDEAHTIKNKMSQMSIGVSKLKSRYRLALTGTPMQNRLDELFPLIRFLNILPYAEWAEFKKLLPPEKSSTTHDFATQRSMATFLSAVMLRRRKDTVIAGRKIIDNLPAKHLEDINIDMVSEERQRYDALEAHIRNEVNHISTTEDISMSNMLVFLLRMRQAVCHPFLISITKKGTSRRIWGKNKETRDAVHKATRVDPLIRASILEVPPQERVCSECDGDASNPCYTYAINGCGHLLCSECAADAQDRLESSEEGHAPCPICMMEYRFLANLEILDVIETSDPVSEADTLEMLLIGQQPRVDAIRKEEEERKRRLKELRLRSNINEFGAGLLFDDSDVDYDLGPSDSFSQSKYDVINESEKQALADIDGNGATAGSSSQDNREHNQEKSREPDVVDVDDPLEYKLDINEIAKLFKVQNIFDDGWVSSAKIESCLDCLRSIWKDSPNDKVILFSNFTSLLDVLTIPLEAAQVPYAQYTGRMNVQERNSTLDEFKTGRCKVLLTSLKAGNVGLTLTQANRVIIVEPFWNPYVEDQAQDRVYRIGQSREVTIYRIRVNDSVEDRIVTLQLNKRALIEGALENGMKTKSQGLSRTDLLYALGLRRRPRPVESLLRRPAAPITEPNTNTTITSQTFF